MRKLTAHVVVRDENGGQVGQGFLPYTEEQLQALVATWGDLNPSTAKPAAPAPATGSSDALSRLLGTR